MGQPLLDPIRLDDSPPPLALGAWQLQAWRRPVRWRLVAAGALVTAIDVALITTAVATGRLVGWAGGIPLGLLATLWGRYLARPVSGIHAHRTQPVDHQEIRMPATRPAPTPTRADLQAAALSYAQRGWHVFPLRPGSKKPAVPNHPAHRCDGNDPRCTSGHTGWEQRATTDPNRITRAWDRHPYGIGIACGPSRLVVIDLDTPKTNGHRPGTWHLAHLEHRTGRHISPTYTVATPSGGQHRYYHAPPGPALTNTASRIAPCIDTRAAGGYVVAPPTRTTAGAYHCTDPRPPAPLPTWFTALLTTPDLAHPSAARPRRPAIGPLSRYVEAAIAGELHRLTTATPGTRNSTLFTVAVALGQLVGAGSLDLDSARQRLLEASSDHVSTGAYSHAQAAQTVASGLHRGANQPRRLPAHLTTQEARP